MRVGGRLVELCRVGLLRLLKHLQRLLEGVDQREGGGWRAPEVSGGNHLRSRDAFSGRENAGKKLHLDRPGDDAERRRRIEEYNRRGITVTVDKDGRIVGLAAQNLSSCGIGTNIGSN